MRKVFSSHFKDFKQAQTLDPYLGRSFRSHSEVSSMSEQAAPVSVIQCVFIKSSSMKGDN